MAKYSITLAIPAYNEEKYLGACLEHAIKNSDNLFKEILVIDNASTDKTAEVASKYSGVRVVREDKKGMVRARQRAFLECSGDILAFIDADTQMPPGWAAKVKAEFENDPSLVCISGPYIYYDLPKWQQTLVKIYWLAGLPVYFVLRYMIVGGNFAIVRDTVEKMGGFDTSIEFYGEDTDIARRAHKFGKVKFNPSLTMPTSGRRFKGQGMFKTGVLYVLNFFSEAFFHKPFNKEYKDIR